tara:strand:- start:35 stop:304 length:270 start_codon:yes stop_codon:yes gene_type:complete
MSRSYPIWNKVTACIYGSSKSYGVKAEGQVDVVIGTSAKNSHDFVSHRTTHRLHDNGDREYRFYVDNVCIKRAILAKGASEIKLVELEE